MEVLTMIEGLKRQNYLLNALAKLILMFIGVIPALKPMRRL